MLNRSSIQEAISTVANRVGFPAPDDSGGGWEAVEVVVLAEDFVNALLAGDTVALRGPTVLPGLADGWAYRITVSSVGPDVLSRAPSLASLEELPTSPPSCDTSGSSGSSAG